jgi:hypothetical protein
VTLLAAALLSLAVAILARVKARRAVEMMISDAD